MKQDLIAVVGATGKTGRRVLTSLQEQGCQVRALSRTSKIPFDWENRETWKPALTDIHSVYVTYYPDLAVPEAQNDIQAFVDLAQSMGVNHLVLLSGRGEQGAQNAEQVVINSTLEWNIVRASWFMQNFSESFMLEGIQAGQLVLPEHMALEPFIDVDDIADVVVAALTRDELRNQVLEVTGPELLSFAQCVDVTAEMLQRDIQLLTVPIESYLEGAEAQGMPADIAWLINELFVNVLDGRNESTTNTIETILQRPAKTFKDYAQDTAATGVWS
ncbi:NAD(P)H-binding protein [Oceaniserpentilla sp. 4NH20-0058]|uniref:SDR family oxidoreductase n=1 Tax=Oceaniserpentilla sp. 4NH20-0058 TaxID=3127660 RepID=UPI003109A40A